MLKKKGPNTITSLNNKVAVITGASRGLGAGLAQVFADAGMKLGLCARTAPTAPDNTQVIASSVDVSDAQAVTGFADQVEQQFGAIDLWINNAGLLDPIAPLRDIDPAAFRQLIEVNVLGVVHGAQAFIRHRRRHGGGVLINISSGAAQHGYAGWSAYCASKSAVDRFSEAIALEEADQGIRIYAVAPGVVDTDMQHKIRSATPDDFPMVDKFHQLKADGAFNSPEFVGRELLALAFDPDRRPDSVVVRVANEWES